MKTTESISSGLPSAATQARKVTDTRANPWGLSWENSSTSPLKRRVAPA